MGQPVDPVRSSSRLSFEGRRPSYHDQPRASVRNAHWTEDAVSALETGSRVVGAVGTAWQIGRGVVQAGRVLGPLLVAAA